MDAEEGFPVLERAFRFINRVRAIRNIAVRFDRLDATFVTKQTNLQCTPWVRESGDYTLAMSCLASVRDDERDVVIGQIHTPPDRVENMKCRVRQILKNKKIRLENEASDLKWNYIAEIKQQACNFDYQVDDLGEELHRLIQSVKDQDEVVRSEPQWIRGYMPNGYLCYNHDEGDDHPFYHRDLDGDDPTIENSKKVIERFPA